MNRVLAAVKVALGVVAVILVVLSILALGSLFAVSESFSVPRLVTELSSKLGVGPVYIYAAVPVLVAAFFMVSAIEDRVLRIRRNDRNRLWRTQTTLALLDALFMALAVDIVWAFLVGGLLTGPGVPRNSDALGPIERLSAPVLSLHSTLSPTVAVAIGTIIGLPLAARTFWKFGPIYKINGRFRLLYRPFDHDRTRVPSNATASRTPRTAPPTTTAQPKASTSTRRSASRWSFLRPTPSAATTKPEASTRTRRPASQWGFLWMGLIVGLGTMAGIAAGFGENPTTAKILLAAFASTAAGAVAAVQWRVTVRRD